MPLLTNMAERLTVADGKSISIYEKNSKEFYKIIDNISHYSTASEVQPLRSKASNSKLEESVGEKKYKDVNLSEIKSLKIIKISLLPVIINSPFGKKIVMFSVR